jgi:aspartyl protease family protein
MFMSGDDTGRLIYLVIILVAALSSLLIRGSGDWGRIWRAGRTWAIVLTIIVMIAAFRQDLMALGSRIMGAVDPARATVSGNQMRFEKREDGHFYVKAVVNQVDVLFLVDTGATTVALSRKDAERAHIDPLSLEFTERVQTANGEARAAPITIDSLSIGPFADRDLRGHVVDTQVSLLGMNALDRYSSVRIDGDVMIIER